MHEMTLVQVIQLFAFMADHLSMLNGTANESSGPSMPERGDSGTVVHLDDTAGAAESHSTAQFFAASSGGQVIGAPLPRR